MADEIITEAAPESVEVPRKNPTEERITQLSDKVKTEAEARQQAESQKTEAEKRARFAEEFVDVLSSHPEARDHKDAIKEKFAAGLSVEDATYAVLGKAGKLGGPVATPQVAGGSAATTVTEQVSKGAAEMTQAERREALSNDPELARILGMVK